MSVNRKLVNVLAAAGLLALAACSESDYHPTAGPGTGQLTVRLTDAPADDVSEINVWVTGLTIKKTDAPVARIANEIGLVDLLTLQGTTMELVELGVPAGDYEYVQVELDQERSNVRVLATGELAPLQIASEEVKVLDGFTVPDGGSLEITLDFDAAASLRQQGNGDWLLVPVIVRVGG